MPCGGSSSPSPIPSILHPAGPGAPASAGVGRGRTRAQPDGRSSRSGTTPASRRRTPPGARAPRPWASSAGCRRRSRRLAAESHRPRWRWRETRRSGTDLVRDLEAPPVAGRQPLGLALAAPPHRPDGVDDPASRQPVAAGGLGIPGIASAQRAALLQRSGPAARWMAPSTPTPPSRLALAALTMASTSSVVMSARTTSAQRQPPPTPCAIAVCGGRSHHCNYTCGISTDGGAPDGPHSDPAEIGGKGAR